MTTKEIPVVSPATEEPHPVDPEVEGWFRDTPLEAAGTIRAGDTIQVSIQNLPEYTVLREIPPDGTLPLYRAPRAANALGKTTQALESEIAEIYADRVDAYVTVSIVTAAPRTLFVSGAVRTPQAYSLRPGERLTVLQAVILAGGPEPEANLANVRIMRFHPDLGRIVSSPALDVDRVKTSGDQSDNLAVLPGDTIVVAAAAHHQIHVFGHVERPGPLRFYEGITLSRAVTETGGFRKFARTSAIRVVRGGNHTIVYDFTELLAGNVEDLVLQPGDVIYVDEQWI
jgi:polysaccharide export outer membrane protein